VRWITVPAGRLPELGVMSPKAPALTLAALLSAVACGGGDTGPDLASFEPPLPAGRTVFPADNDWNRVVSLDMVDANSDSLIARCGGTHNLHPDFGTVYGGAPWGIPFITVSGSQPRVPVSFDYDDESDPGPYPVPSTAGIEGGPSAS